MIEPDIQLLNSKLSKLQKAVSEGRSRSYCLSKWSNFVRYRDGQRCVDCHEANGLSAHHIFRKVIASPAQFDPGNGITLCRQCHKVCHKDFNRRPNMSLPIDAEGGEKLEVMERLYFILHQDSVERDLAHEPFYSLSAKVISMLKKMHGYSANSHFPGSSLQQASMILATCEKPTRDALLAANGFSFGAEPIFRGTIQIFLK